MGTCRTSVTRNTTILLDLDPSHTIQSSTHHPYVFLFPIPSPSHTHSFPIYKHPTTPYLRLLSFPPIIIPILVPLSNDHVDVCSKSSPFDWFTPISPHTTMVIILYYHCSSITNRPNLYFANNSLFPSFLQYQHYHPSPSLINNSRDAELFCFFCVCADWLVLTNPVPRVYSIPPHLLPSTSFPTCSIVRNWVTICVLRRVASRESIWSKSVNNEIGFLNTKAIDLAMSSNCCALPAWLRISTEIDVPSNDGIALKKCENVTGADVVGCPPIVPIALNQMVVLVGNFWILIW